MTNKIKKSLLKNSFWAFWSSMSNRFGSLIFTVILTRFLLPERYGLYSLALSVSMVFLIFTDLGTGQAFIRYLSSALAREKKKINAYYTYILKIKFILTFITSIILLAVSYPLSVYVFQKPELFLILLVSSLYVFLLSFEGFYTGIFYAKERVEYISLKEFLSQVSKISLTLAVFFIFAVYYYVIGVFLVLIFTTILMILFSMHYSKKLIPELYKKSDQNIDRKRVLKYLLYASMGAVSSVLFSHVDSIMLGIFVESEFIGFYRAAFSLVLGVSGLIGFPIVNLLPVFSKVSKKKIQMIFNESFRYMASIILPSIFGLLALGRYFIVFLFGYSYLDSYIPFYFLIFLIFPMILSNIFLYLLLSKEKTQITARLIIITGTVNIILNFILIRLLLSISPIWATAGAGLATLISWIVYFAGAMYYTKKVLKIKPDFKPFFKPLVASLAMYLIILYLISMITDMTLFLGIMLIATGIIIYFSIMFLIKGIEKKDLALIKIIFKK